MSSEIKEIEITTGNEIHAVFCGDHWIWFDPEFEKATVDTRKMYFECLN
jgi:hypothetical protein